MINNETLKSFESRLTNQDKAVAGAIAKVGMKDASLNNDVLRRHNHQFSVKTKRGDITAQKRSGRCWMFAALNTARVDVMKKFDLETFEFSQNYSLFWDKLERSNYVLDAIIDTVEEELDSRVVAFLLNDPLGDGGQWDMYKAILNKYGAVPKDHMPETYHSSNTTDMNRYLTSMLRFYASQLRKEYAVSKNKETLETMKEDMLYQVYNILVKSLGTPPTTVNFEYEDKNKEYHRLDETTPQAFFKEVSGWTLENKISIINAPTKDKPYNKLYTVKYLGNVVEAPEIRYINLPMDKLKKLAIKSIQAGDPVWFGCDVGQLSDRLLGIMDLDTFNYELTLDFKPAWSKEDRLDYYESLLTHAMVLTGVDLDAAGNPINWQVENSWGDQPGKKGMFSMSTEWMDEFTYQIMIDKKYLDAETAAILDQEVIELAPWDPMGALAK